MGKTAVWTTFYISSLTMFRNYEQNLHQAMLWDVTLYMGRGGVFKDFVKIPVRFCH